MSGGKPPKFPLTTAAEALELRTGRISTVFRLTVAFMGFVFLTFVSVEGWKAWRDYERVYSSAHDSVVNLARATAQHAEDAIRQVDLLTGVLAERVEVDGLENIEKLRTHSLMVQQAKVLTQLHGLFIYGADGQWVVTDRNAAPETENNADRDYFVFHSTHPDRSVRIGDVIRSRSSGDLILPISRRLDNPDGSFAGVVLGTIRMSYFMDYYEDFKIDEQGALVLAARDGTILMRRPFAPSVIGQSLASSDIFKDYLLKSNEGVAEVDAVIDGTSRIYGYRALDNYPLVVATGLSRESIVGPWRSELFKTLLILFSLMASLAGFGALLLSQLRKRTEMEEEIRFAHQTVRELALTDSLTGLGNRRRLDMTLEDEISRAKRQNYPLSLVMIDVDYFKRFNDRYGHPAGDDCLRLVAIAIAQALKRPEDVAIRYGGEEFTLLLPKTTAFGASQVAQDILQSVQGLGVEHNDSPYAVVTASAGVITVLPAGEPITPAAIIKSADDCLYIAKRNGRNRLHAFNSGDCAHPIT